MDVRRLPGYPLTNLQMTDDWSSMTPFQSPPPQQQIQQQPITQQTCSCLGCTLYPKVLNYLGALTIAQTIIIVMLAKQRK